MEFLCVLKMYHVRLFIVEKMGLERLLDYGIHSKPQPLLQKTCHFDAFQTLAAYACFSPRRQADAHVRGAEGYFGLLFPKIGFCSFKRLYFSF